MADRTGPWKRQGVIPASRRPPENRTDYRTDPLYADPLYADPLYHSVLRNWCEQGRTIPGRPDPEWRRLIERDPWPRG